MYRASTCILVRPIRSVPRENEVMKGNDQTNGLVMDEPRVSHACNSAFNKGINELWSIDIMLILYPFNFTQIKHSKFVTRRSALENWLLSRREIL